MERYIVDWVTEGIIRLEKEDMTHIEVKESEIPFKVNEGNVLIYYSGAFTLDKSGEDARRKKIFEKQKNIFKNK